MILPGTVLAHPGNTASDGCHYCWTNCDSWGEVYGERHCHGGGSYDYDYPTTPTCPSMSSYNSLTDKCECYSGYIASGDQCISVNQYCWNNYGYGSTYSYLSDSCECSYGYVMDSSGQCTLGSSVCSDKYGFHSRYNSADNTCECSYGYRFNSSGTKCISDDEACQEVYGYGSKATISGDKCECKYGYIWEGNRCVLDTSDYEESAVNIPPPVALQDTPPSVAGVKAENYSPTQEPSPTDSPDSTLSPGIQGTATETSSSQTPLPEATAGDVVGGLAFGVGVLGLGYLGLRWLAKVTVPKDGIV
ncbi:YHYH domain-containing protein [Candidatus Woesebacteria bacterium]|nr:YHYH domain-containing protein [Candidatus Woesebacteria bacterium]